MDRKRQAFSFFFSSRRRHTSSTRDWSSDVCSSDLGESWPIFHARVDRAWQAIQARAAEADSPLAVITHGLVCRSIAARHVVLPDGITVPERWENTSVTIVDGPTPWRVRLLNCVVHLDGLEAATDATAV